MPLEEGAQDEAPQTVACEFCHRVFKARGLSRHLKSCKKKNQRELVSVFSSIDWNTLANIRSYMSNQTLVKLQSITGAKYPGASPSASSICCPCENDELAVANGLCLACNRQKDETFRETITTTEARRIYGEHDINSVPHKRYSVYHRGYYCIFKYADVQRYVLRLHGSKLAWLESLAVKVNRRKKLLATKKRNEDEYHALLCSFSEGFDEFILEHCTTRQSEKTLIEQSERFDLMVAALKATELTLEDDKSGQCAQYVLHGVGQADRIAGKIVARRQQEAERRSRKEKFGKFLRTLPKKFVTYMGRFELEMRPDETLATQQSERYEQLVAALAARGLQLRDDSQLCRLFIRSGTGVIEDVVDTMEEMKFLYEHTTYSAQCRAKRPYRSEYRSYYYSDSDGSSSDGEEQYQAAVVSTRERVKQKIMNQCIRNPPNGVALPRKWERLRQARNSPGSPTY